MNRFLKLFQKSPLLTTVGMQLSADNVSLFLLNFSNEKKPEIFGYISIDIDKKQSPDAVQETLLQYINEKGLKGANCCLTLDDDDYQILVIEAPNVAEDEMAEAVKWKIKDLVSHNLSDIVIDVFLQEDGFSSNKKMANAVVVPKEIIQIKTAFIESLGLQLKAIDIPELSYRNYLEHHGRSEESTAMVVVKRDSGKLSVIHNNQVCFTRTFPVAYDGGLHDPVPESDIVLELQRSFDYYERQLRRSAPQKVIFCGDNVTDEKIGSLTREGFNQQVLVENPVGYDFQDKDIYHSSRIIAAYGASLRQGLVEAL